MSTNRSSSTVRNLRAMFEGNDVNAERPSSTTSDRTSQGEGESRSRVSKIRASFVSVDRPGDLQSMNGENAPTIMEGSTNGTQPPQDIQSTLVENGDGQHDSKPVAGVEAEATGATELANANGPSTEAASTLEIEEPQESITQEVVKGEEKVESEAMTLPEKDTPAANPDKPTTAVEEEPGPLRPANPADVDTANAIPSSPNKNVSKKQSRTSLSRTAAQADSTAGTPATVSKDESPSKAKAVASKPSLNFRQSKLGDSPATKISSPKSPRRPTTSDSKSSETSHKPTTPSKTSSKPARSSLTAQTAASAARSKGASEATNGTSAASKG
ncbi:hypothetical protein K461DRAFT_138189 [Myriangium duriaei CBS 260.36]|uniref:Uncharacterized protein n=1 Tax=Myriangium duriaei CBS 260.36 TaxID=1168546 RepID=A0A9P4J0K8_9PEZI|nr:hypothetical protein K461DRAFT_138189 [Myriangium duriaei CBS 260.36]